MLVAEQLHKRPKMGSLVPNPAYDPTGVDGLGTTMQALAAVEATESGLREGVSADVVCAEPFGAFPDVRPQPVGPLSPLSCPPLASYGADDFDKQGQRRVEAVWVRNLGARREAKTHDPREGEPTGVVHARCHTLAWRGELQTSGSQLVGQASAALCQRYDGDTKRCAKRERLVW